MHLILLQRLQAPYYVEEDLMTDVLAFAPFTLLLADWFANRFYIPLPINAAYAVVFYALASLAWLILAEVETRYRLPELRFMTLQEDLMLSLLLPVMIMAGVYALQRAKFWYLGDGDLTFDFNAWAKQAQDRMDYIEEDGAREEEIFRFNVENENPAIKGGEHKNASGSPVKR